MDLIILIVFVALAMLVPNIKAAKKRQQTEGNGTPGDAEAASGDSRDALESLLRQLSGQNENRSAAAGNSPNNGQAHGYNRKKRDKAKPRIDNRTATPAATDAPLHPSSPIGSIDEPTKGKVDDATDPIGCDDDAKRLREDFNLRDAVLYSEILKPKFDNND